MEEKEFSSAEELHDSMYEILESHGLKPQKAFQAIYKMILGQKQGPRAASFLLSLDKDGEKTLTKIFFMAGEYLAPTVLLLFIPILFFNYSFYSYFLI